MENVLTGVNVNTGKQLTGYENILMNVNFPSITVSGASLDTLTQGTPLNDWVKTPTTIPTPLSASTPKKEETDSTWWIWLIVALVVIIGGTAAAVFFK